MIVLGVLCVVSLVVASLTIFMRRRRAKFMMMSQAAEHTSLIDIDKYIKYTSVLDPNKYTQI